MKKYANPEITLENIKKSYKNDFKEYSNENLIRIKILLNDEYDSKISFSKKPGREFAVSQLKDFMKTIDKKKK